MNEFRFTDEQWRDYQAMPDQGYSHRHHLEAVFNGWLTDQPAPATHFIATLHDVDCDPLYGVYSSFDAARADVEARTAVPRADRDGEYGIDMAQIQEWDGPTILRTWERDWKTPRAWNLEYERPERTPE